MSLQAGTILAGRYRVLTRLGEGGMGSVYQVADLTQPGRVWAMKELLDDASASPEDRKWARDHFKDEIALMRRLAHPRIPTFERSFTEGSRSYFVMQFIAGTNLEERLERAHAPLPERDVLGWVITICGVLTYLHEQRPPIIVRDLKPGNIMVTPGGEAYLIDFGIARTYKPNQRSNTENLGTMTYASPEHLGQAQTDARSDIYSLGATMFHLLTNTEPTPMETPAPGALRRLNPSVSEATERAVIRAMQLDPTLRFKSASAFADVLSRSRSALGPTRSENSRASQPVVLPRGAAASVSSGGANARASSAVVAPRRAPATRARVVPTGIVCPHCGYINRQGAKFCARDGTPFTSKAPAASATRAGVPTTHAIPAIMGTAELNLQRAQESFKAGRYMQAAQASEAAITQGRATTESYLLQGRAYRKLGRPSEAATAFAQAVRLRPTPEALLEEGLAWREAGEATKAQVALTQARQLAPRDAAIAYQLGLVCLDQGHLAQAEGEFREALALRPGDASTLVALGRVAAARKAWTDALEFYQQALAATPNDPVAYLEMGRALLAQQRFNDALRPLEQSIRYAPNSTEAQVALGACYHALGRRNASRDALRRALALDPRNSEAQQLLKRI